MTTLIFSRTLKLQAGLKDETASLTLISSDIDRLAMSLEAFCDVWAQFVELSLGLVLLGRQLGWVCVAPILIVAGKPPSASHSRAISNGLGSTLCASKVTKLIGPRQKVWISAVQKRVSMTSSMLGSMKSVKMMGLSSMLFDTLQSQRVRELNLSKKFRVMGMWRMMLCKWSCS